ncbi:MAG: ATP-dependent helicase [Lachnospiraceae bacterium]
MNSSQMTAIQHGEGPMLLLAGPGSGKTYVITHRIQYLIKHAKVLPTDILVITFTKASSVEMQERFQKLMEDDYYPVTFGTFHAIFFHILQHAYHFTYSNIITEQEKQEYMNISLSELPEQTLQEMSENDSVSLLLAEIGKVKNQGISIANYHATICDEDVFRTIYVTYQNILKQHHKIDFDDMLLLCYTLLQQNKEIRTRWQAQYRYLLIDEFQDINQLQYAIVKQLAHPCNNIFAVGDDDQAIYGFRGSKPEIMKRFLNEYHAAEGFLAINYRSTDAILQASQQVISENKDRFVKHTRSNKQSERAEPVMLHAFPTKREEHDTILQLIEQYHTQHDFSEIAIIYRTNYGASSLSEQLVEHKIPFHMKEHITSIYRHFIAKDIRAYFECSLYENREPLYRIMNKPKRYLSRAAVSEHHIDYKAIRAFYQDKPYMHEKIRKLEYDIKLLRNMNPYAAINYIRRGIGYEEYLEQTALDQKIAMQEWREILDEIQERAKPYATLNDWMKHIEVYEKALEEDKRDHKNKKDVVSILTMHGAKGLEYPFVILPDLNEGQIPHKKAQTKEELEEERRLFYVAMTRAKDRLCLFWIGGTKEEPVQASRYLKKLIQSNTASDQQ